MASAKKNKKKKAQTLSLGEFLGDDAPQVITTTSWADEMEQQPDADEADYGGPKVVINRATLPTAPRASRGANVDMSQVPTEPPFTAYIGNLPFDATSEDVERFFKGLKVLGVRLPSESGRAKGFGYAEFEDRQSLLDALALNDATMRNRQIRVDLASHGQQDRDRRDGDRDHRRGDRDGDDDKTLGDWRSGGRDKRDDSDRDRPFDRDSRGGDRYGDRSDRDRRDGYRFGGDRGRYDDRDRNRYDDRDRGRFDDRGDRGRYDDRDRGRFDDRDRGRFDNRDRDDYSSKSSFGSGFRDRDRERSDRFPPRDRDRYDDRYKDGGAAREWPREGNDRPKDSEDRYRDSRERVRDDDRPREFDRSRDSRDFNRDGEKPRTDRNRDSDGGRDSGPDQDNAQRRPPRSPVRSRDSSGDRSRPESDRYRPVANGPKERPRLKLQPRSKPLEEAGQVTATSAIFGGAKPVDTAAREREIEERLMKKPGGDRVDKENRSASDDDHVPHARDDHVPHARTSVSSDTSKPLGDDISKRRNSGERSRKESSSSSQDGPSKKERYASTSSGKGSSRKLSNDVEDASDNESETSKKSMKKDKAAAEKTPPVKLVPAPPPKENIWEKRKSENQAAKQQQTSPAVITEDKKVEEQVEKESTMTDSASDADSCKRTQSDDGVSSCSGVSDTGAQTASTHAVEQQTKAEPAEAAPAEPPTQAQVNVWEARRKEQDTRKAPGRGDAPPVRKTATVSVAGRGGSWAAGPPKRVEVDTHSTSQSSKKKDREKPLPTSIDAMPKLEDKCSRDWSDANKFSTLMGDEDEKGEEVAEEED